MDRLPVELILPDVVDALERYHALVIQAPPGAGKTTRVPPALLGARWLGDRVILMLEPRRLATRAAARFMAAERRESIGQTVGYRMRGESHVGPRTRIEVVTEGVLVRRLQHDPTLEDVGAIIFDEFHERSLDADLSLALTLRTRSLVREDLRLIAMSATLDGSAVARLLGDAPILTSEGRVFPVDTRYISPRSDLSTEANVASTVRKAIDHDRGDVLVFLPGAAEIRRTASILNDSALGRDVVVLPLFGTLSQTDQDAALARDSFGRRKVVLATSIAETSLTIDGIGVVIDSGLSRGPRFSPRTGMTRLETVRVSRASAEQRRGRAGRLGPGVCYRLWPEHENHHLLASTPPEIANADLAPLALSLAAAGVNDPLELSWIDPPAPAPFARARELLSELGAIDEHGEITTHGNAMNELPVHPRLAHMLLRAKQLDAAPLAARIAALLSERDIVRSSDGPVDPNIRARLDVLDGRETEMTGGFIDRDLVRRVRQEAERLSRALSSPNSNATTDLAGKLLALAYPDRIGQARSGARGRYLLRNGRGAELPRDSGLSNAAYIVAAELDDRKPESRIFVAAEITLDEIRSELSSQITIEERVFFEDATSSVRATRRELLGAIALRDVTVNDPDADAVRRALMDAIARRGVGLLSWTDAATRYRRRMAFLWHHDETWPDVSDASLVAQASAWLEPALQGHTSFDNIDLVDALSNLLDWRQRRALDELAPTHIEVPTGSRIAVDYTNPDAPVLPVRIQEVFGWSESPRLLNGRVVVTMELLSPAHRPVQITRDLGGFWKTSYFDVRKDLRGRYPKHEWPDDPMAATPTRRAKPRR